MNSINKNQSRRVTIIVVVVIVVSLLIGGLAFAISQGLLITQPTSSQTEEGSTDTGNGSTVDNNPPTKDQTDAGKNIKEDSVDNDSESSENPDTISVSVTATPLDEEDTVRVQTTIQKVTNSGKCTLTVEKDNDTRTYTSDVQAVTDYSTCKGFTVNNLTSGTWTITLKYTSGSISATDTTKVTL